MISVNFPGQIKSAKAPGLALDSGVWFRFVTQEDSAVRPSHAALHGTVWRIDDPRAPMPPLDYGCRCGIEYVADPNSPAADALEPADRAPIPAADAFSVYLDKELPKWEKYADRVKGSHREDYVNDLALEIQKGEGWNLTKSRDYAEMVARVRLAD